MIARPLIILIALALLAGIAIANPATASAATKTNTLAVTAVVAIPADMTAADNTWTTAKITALLKAANTRWSTESSGAVKIGVPSKVAVVQTAALSTDPAKSFAATVAAEQKFVTGPWKGLVVFTPATSVVSLAEDNVGAAAYGNGTKNGGSMVVSARSKTTAQLQITIGHEFGHFFSIAHANRLGCADGSVDSLPNAAGSGWANTTCASIEYDDTNDIMSNGYSAGALNSVLASSAGFVKSTDVLDVTATATTTAYTLLPWADKTVSTSKAIRIADPATGIPFYVELRQPVGLDAGDATGVRAGVKILKKNSDGSGSVVLDPTPTMKTFNTDGKQTWDKGSVFVNASKTIAVSVTDVGATSATVAVTRVTPATSAAFQKSAEAPQVVATATTGNSYYGAAGSLALTAKTPSGAGIPGTVAITEGTTALGTATLAADGTATFALPKTTTAGTHNYTLVHSDSDVRSSDVTYTVAKAVSTVVATAGPTAIAVKVVIPTNTALLGTLAVTRDGAAAGTVALTKANGGTGSFDTGTLAPGAHDFVFSYPGAASTEPAAATVTVTVVDPTTVSTVTGTSSGPSVYYGPQAVIAITAKSAAGVALPGTVTISEGATVVGSVAVPASGVASFTLPKTVAAGSHTYRLVHSDAAVQPGTVVQTVDKAATATSAVASATTLAAGDASATVSLTASIPSSAGLVGTVTVTDDGQTMPAVKLTSATKGVGTYAVGALAPGVHTLVFTYSGGANTQPSSTQVVITAN